MSRAGRARELARALRDLQPPGGLQRYRAARGMGRGFPPGAAVYRDLSPFSLRLSRVVLDGTGRGPRVNLLLPSARPAEIFAGARTAIEFGGALAAAYGIPLAVGTVNPRSSERGSQLDASIVPGSTQGAIPVFRLGDGDAFPMRADDLWVATHWATAHALDIACRVGVIDPRRVVYLVQDYEPGFVPWSTDYALIRATYHAGFTLVVNSQPLAAHLEREEGVAIDPALVVAPHVPLDRLAEVAEQRAGSSGRVGVFFYARPTKPRNLYPLGVTALRRTGQLLGADARRLDVITAGEPHPAFEIPGAGPVTAAGQTGWDGYFDLLSRVHVGLSLMYSPHPSHPPLELAISGARGVTNRFADARDGLHPRLVAAEADPEALAAALADAVRAALDDPAGAFAPLRDGALGRPLEAVVDALVARLPQGIG